GADHCVTRPYPLRHQHQDQRIGSARARHHVPRAAELRELGFERADFGAQDELTMREHAGDRLVNREPQASPLRRNVNEWDRHGIKASSVLLHRQTVIIGGGEARKRVRRRGPARRRLALAKARCSRQRMAISRLATPSSPVTVGSLPSRIAPTKACSSARNGSAWPTERWRIE